MQEVFEKIKERLEEKAKEYERKAFAMSNPATNLFAQYMLGAKFSLEDEAIEIVKEVAEEYAANINVGRNGWIPCSKDIPKENEEVLITTKTTGKVYKGTYTKRYGFSMREGLMCDSVFISASEVIAWQPSPEPYKEKEDD